MKKIEIRIEDEFGDTETYKLEVYGYEILPSGVLDLRHRRDDDTVAHEFFSPNTWKTVRDL